MVEKYGFVYIWRDRKHKRYYVGCHWGREDDGYICSSNWMRNTYNRRPEDFKRRILKTNISTRKDTFLEEQRYLNMIKSEEVRVRYFNLHITVGHWSSDENKRKEVSDKLSMTLIERFGEEKANEIKEKISKAAKGRKPPITGKHHSEESKKKMSDIRMGKVLSAEHKENIKNSLIGRPSPMKGKNQSDEAKLNISNANRGKVISEEHKKSISKAHKGKMVSEETKDKLKQLYKGKTYEEIHGEEKALEIKKKLSLKKHSEETKKKISDINKGKVLSEEHKEKLRNKIVTEETKQKIRESLLGRKRLPRTDEEKRKISEGMKKKKGISH